ncbi:hypothetical protein PR202_gb02910 [Eleusine coracana subsp. coracana]|uniref:Alpha/beta hydrolase fold-3 domain-containing protein n=1 Tax=Eleusine coracana subsp. coracana TaxID=191504 RepID=A0AAV5E0C6_ELECO|nr:hypothetical protein QOZ80_8BG0663260 [Eleusine coracana subsp. coracana]GJN15961.1 hypothetical protein PR202_gb02910 [Eleusine coracana subsp. coracana]
MDPDHGDIDFDFSPFLIRYKSGRVRRLMGTSRLPAGTDAATGVACKDVVIDAATGLAARLYIPGDILLGDDDNNNNNNPETKLPLLVFFHGGAFAVHSAFSRAHSGFLNALVRAARVVAVSVDYRLAPEHRVPAAYDDAWAALRWAVAAGCSASGPAPEPWLADHADAARLFVAGDSAGANIAHNVAMRAGKSSDDGPRIEGMVLLHPYFRGKEPLPSELANPKVMARAERSWAFVCAGEFDLDHPFINPLAMPAAEWAALGCRRALVTVAELDTLRDRGRRYVETLRGSAWAGEEAVLYETEGEGHVYFIDKSGAGGEKAAREMAAVVAFIRRQG